MILFKYLWLPCLLKRRTGVGICLLQHVAAQGTPEGGISADVFTEAFSIAGK